MKKTIHIGIILLSVGYSVLFIAGNAHAQYFDDFYDGGYSDFGYADVGYSDPCGFGGCGGFDYGWSGGYSDPCSFGGCGGDFSIGFAPSFVGGFGGGCGSFCYGPGFSTVPIIQPYISPIYHYIPPPIYTPPPVYVPPPVYTPPPPVYIPPPIYTSPPVYNPPVAYNPPMYTAPPVYYPPPTYSTLPPPPQPIICGVSFVNFKPPLSVIAWNLYVYQVYATGNVSGQMSYRIVTGPDGLAINPQTGLISWTPAMNQARANPYQVTVAAYNGSCENAQTFYITVINPQAISKPKPITKPKPQPMPVCCECACPPAVAEKPAVSPCPVAPAVTGTSDSKPNANGLISAGDGLFGAAIAGFGGILAMIRSPITLFLIIIILVILLIRAYRRVQATQIVI